MSLITSYFQQKLEYLRGWRYAIAFTLIDKMVESKLVTIFIFIPVDDKPVIGFKPSQYISLGVCASKREFKEIRQYSLSNKANNETYGIPVKLKK